MDKYCKNCELKFTKSKFRSKKSWSVAKYCSHNCSNKANGGKPTWNKGKPNTWYNPKGLELGHGWNKGIPNLNIVGDKNPSWRGGVTSENKKVRGSIEYALWRTAVFMRDNHTCQKCNHRGGNMHADHIKPFSLYPELRFAIDNGRTLCVECHRQTDTYGYSKIYLPAGTQL